ncbi:MAG: metallophosphoesterase [Desulfurococcales archaeon]|nr:metallophosphoesterase [Desulfurococcales archaeon]
MKRTVLSLLVVTLAIMFVLHAYTLTTVTATNTMPLGWEHPSLFTDLLTAYTAHVKPGGEIEVHLAGNYSILSGYIFTVGLKQTDLIPINKTIDIREENGVVFIRIPQDTPTGVYDLFIKTTSGLYRIPQSIWVSKDCSLPIRIAHFTDEHFDLHPDYYTSAAILAKLLGAQLVIGTGDATDTASELQAKHYVMHRSSFLYGLPVVETPGNHDYESDNTGTPYFKKYIAPEYWYKNYCNKILIIGLTTGKERDVITEQELYFTKNVLANNTNVPIKIIGYHHPFFWHHGNVTSTYNDPNLVNYLSTGFWYGKNANISLEFLKLIEEYKVELTLQGHVHSDSIVNFTSTMTGYKTWFVTTTTIGGPHAPEIYNGFEIMDVYPNDTVKFPFAPPTFNVPVTHSVNRGVYPKLSIPVQDNYPEHFYAKYYSYGSTFALEIDNTLSYLSISRPILIRVPWTQNNMPEFFLTKYSTSGSIKVLNATLPGDGYLYLLLSMNLPTGSHLILVGTTQGPDNTPPTASIKMTIPRTPRVGSTLTMYIQASDDGWGIKSISAVMNNKQLGVVPSGKYYLISIKLKQDNTSILLTVEDLAGHKSLYTINIANGKITLAPYTPTQTTSTTTTTTSTTQTSQTQTSTTTSTTTTSSPTQTTTTTTTSSTTTSSPTSSPTQTITGGSQSETSINKGSSYTILWVSVIVAILIIAAALLLKR